MPCLALPCLAFPRFQGCLPSYCNECAAAASEADRHFAFGPGTGDGDADDLQSTTSPTLAMEYLYEYGVCAGWSRDDACRAATGLSSLRRRPTQRARNIAALRLLLLPPSQPTCSHVHAEPIAPSNSSQRLRGRRRPQGPPSRAWYHGSPVAGVDEKRRGAHLLSARCRKRAAAEPSADTWSKEREQRSFTNGAGRQAGKLPAPSYECRSGGDVDSGQAREEEREASRQTDGSSSKSPANGRAPLQGQRWAGKGGGGRRLQGVPCAVPDASPISDACPATGNEHVAWCGRLPQIPPWQSAVTRLVLQPVRLSTSYYTRRRKNVRTWGLTVVRRSKTAVRCSSSPQLVAAAKYRQVSASMGQFAPPVPAKLTAGRPSGPELVRNGSPCLRRVPRRSSDSGLVQAKVLSAGARTSLCRAIKLLPAAPVARLQLQRPRHRPQLPAAERHGSSGRVPGRFLVAGQLDSCATPTPSHGAAKEEIGPVRTTIAVLAAQMFHKILGPRPTPHAATAIFGVQAWDDSGAPECIPKSQSNRVFTTQPPRREASKAPAGLNSLKKRISIVSL
ncbi:hypothetical protein Purlil1_6994 [Purpureocillium lilacinum]|uniref:Uncharacterized protein n=1 Tax=Purpureocillium lilacinum TaxID=33203 RepID=A0ABR0BXG3_PURLI|nr:hypothetical protein Purlil1_6994 [Purpureocillium lilacinum]